MDAVEEHHMETQKCTARSSGDTDGFQATDIRVRYKIVSNVNSVFIHLSDLVVHKYDYLGIVLLDWTVTKL